MKTHNHFVENFSTNKMVKLFTERIEIKINEDTLLKDDEGRLFAHEVNNVINQCALLKMHYSGNSYSQEELIRIVYTKILSLIKIRKPKNNKCDFASYIEEIIIDSIDTIKEEIVSKNIEADLREMNEKLAVQDWERKIKVFESNDLNAVYDELYDYNPLIRHWARKLKLRFYNLPLEVEDLQNELFGHLCMKMDKFIPTYQNSLYPYINKVLKYTGINICRKLVTNKNKLNNFSYNFGPIDEYIANPEFGDVDVEEIWDIINGNKEVFTEMEFSVLRSYCRTESLKLTAMEMNMNRQTVQRHFRSASLKFINLWNEASL